MKNRLPNLAPPPLQQLLHDGVLAASDAEKYRWIRAHRGNAAIVRALSTSQRDADFDLQIEREMAMTSPLHGCCPPRRQAPD